MLYIGFLILACALSWVLCWRFLHPGSVFHVLDVPNQRSLHQETVPRSGGVAILVSLILPAVLATTFGYLPLDRGLLWLVAGVLILGVTGFVDDRQHLPVLVRLLIQSAVALIVLINGWQWTQLPVPGGYLDLGVGAAGLLVWVYVLWMTNLYNFMDGMDGLAAAMSIIGFSTLAVFGWLGNQHDFMFLNGLIVASVCGFLYWNFPPAKIFMGDSGSLVLGFLAAACSLWGATLNLYPEWIPLLVFSPFIVDASWTLLKRLIQGEKVWQPHREHMYQRLALLGYARKRILLWIVILMMACAASAIGLSGAGLLLQWAGLAGWFVIYVWVIWAVEGMRRKAG